MNRIKSLNLKSIRLQFCCLILALGLNSSHAFNYEVYTDISPNGIAYFTWDKYSMSHGHLLWYDNTGLFVSEGLEVFGLDFVTNMISFLINGYIYSYNYRQLNY